MQTKIILIVIGIVLIAIGGSLVYIHLVKPSSPTSPQQTTSMITALSLPTQAEVNQTIGSQWHVIGMLVLNDSQSVSNFIVKNGTALYVEVLQNGNVSVTIEEYLFNSTHFKLNTSNASIKIYKNIEIVSTVSGNKSAVDLAPFVNLAYSVILGDNGTVPSVPSYLILSDLKFVEFGYYQSNNNTEYTIIYRNTSVQNINISYVEIQVLNSPNASGIYSSYYSSVEHYVNQSTYNGATYFNFSSIYYGYIIVGYKGNYLIYISSSSGPYFNVFMQIVDKLPSM
ncbi:MAG: hypothetical protein OWQ54_04945 [Sulfolobaceae archaeon]|nr:hypothetical protein [Sulfolobaceae archaeon]